MTQTLRLSALHKGARGSVTGLDPHAQGASGVDVDELERRLLEMGFVEGACFQILHEGLLGRDPIAIRLDDMRVALRRREAQAVLVNVAAPDSDP